VLRTSASEKVAADLPVVGNNGSLSALVSIRAAPAPSLPRARAPPSLLLCSVRAGQRLVSVSCSLGSDAGRSSDSSAPRRSQILIPSAPVGFAVSRFARICLFALVAVVEPPLPRAC
jgi:hypothetical protein